MVTTRERWSIPSRNLAAGLTLALFWLAMGLPAHAAPPPGAPDRVSGPAPGTPSASPSAADRLGIRLLTAPVNLDTDPRAYVYIIDHLNPGTTIRRQVEISTTSAAGMHVDVYPGAAKIANHSFTPAGGRTGNELTSWVKVDHGTLDLPGDGAETVNVTITVPPHASDGERYGVLWAQTRSGANASANVTQISRVGIRLYLDVGPGGGPAPNFQISRLKADRAPDGVPSVTATVRNTGARALDIGGSLSLSDGPGGARTGPFPVTDGTTLAAGDTGPVTVVLDKHLPNGPWTAHLTLRSDAVSKDVTARLTFPDPGKTGSVINLLSHVWRIAIGASAGIAVLLTAGLVIYLRRRTQPLNAPR